MTGLPPTTSRWRLAARKVIAEALAALPPGLDAKAKRKAVSEKYPFGPREMLPYKMWLLELNLALGLETKAPPIPKWYAVNSPQERAFLDALREDAADRATAAAYADWLTEQGDGRGHGWAKIAAREWWPLQIGKGWRWEPRKAHMLLYHGHELPEDVYDRLRNGIHVGYGDHDERYAHYRNLIAALCDAATAGCRDNH